MSATEQSTRSARKADIRSFYRLSPILIVLAGLLAGCGEEAGASGWGRSPARHCRPTRQANRHGLGRIHGTV